MLECVSKLENASQITALFEDVIIVIFLIQIKIDISFFSISSPSKYKKCHEAVIY